MNYIWKRSGCDDETFGANLWDPKADVCFWVQARSGLHNEHKSAKMQSDSLSKNKTKYNKILTKSGVNSNWWRQR